MVYGPASMAGERTIDAGTPESRRMAEGVRRAVGCTERLNAIPYEDRERIAAAWSELTGQPVDPTLHLIPPVYSDCGLNLRLGRNVFVNQGCRLDDIGGIELGDDVMLGPGVRLISSGPPARPGAPPTPGHRGADRRRTQRLDRRRGHRPAGGHDRRRRGGGRRVGGHR